MLKPRSSAAWAMLNSRAPLIVVVTGPPLASEVCVSLGGSGLGLGHATRPNSTVSDHDRGKERMNEPPLARGDATHSNLGVATNGDAT